MQGANIPAGSLGALNEHELEILHLLANGHTAKSIAARLGRSETAINERLRDARRKTGIGSSRELARLLDAQKIWDKNIDLAAQHPSADSREQAPITGFEWTRGRIAMLITISAAALGLTVIAGPTIPAGDPGQQPAAPADAVSPLAGRWSLDVSKIPAEERPQSVMIEFDPAPDGSWTTHVEIVDPDGTRRFADSTARTDGVAVPVTGNMTFIDSGSLKQPEGNTLVMTLGKNGRPVSTRVYTVAEDGQSLTETIIWPGESVPKLETTTFRRVG